MKKSLFIASLLLFGVGTYTAPAYAQQSKEYKKQAAADHKAAEKIAKKKAKELKKEKWEYTGVMPLEMALTNYYLETLPECGGDKQPVEHEIDNAQTVSVAEKTLLLNAQALYAQEIQAMLGADLANSTSSEGGADFEAYVARVAAKVKHEFNGDIRRAILLKRRNGNGKTWTVRAYYTIDENAGRIRAKRIADELERNNGMIDSIHSKVFNEE